MLHPPVPEKIWFYPIDRAKNKATFKALDSSFSTGFRSIRFSAAWASRRARVAELGDARRARRQHGRAGGERRPHRLLPGDGQGALLYLGDGHAAMGDGEIAGTAIEVPMHARLQVD